MSYPVGTSISYVASASTAGLPSDTFTYSWTFDDGATGVNASLNHTWGTTGLHSATVTATDTNTFGTATASNSIQVDPYTWANIGSGAILQTNSIGLQLSPTSVMMCGGGQGSTKTTQVFNGTSWSYGSTMNCYRYLPYYSRGASVQLHDGTWLVAGGTWNFNYTGWIDGSGKTAETYDPVSTHWTVTGLMNNARGAGGLLLLLPSGKAAIFGGMLSTTKTYEVYDPTTRTWAYQDAFNNAYELPGAIEGNSGLFPSGLTLADGRLFVIDAGNTSGHTYIYTESTNTWYIGPDLPAFDTANQRGFIVQSGNYVYTSGYDDTNQQFFSRYDLTANTWTRLADCPYPAGDLTAIAMSHGIMVYGCSQNTPHPTSVCSYYYIFATNTWSTYNYYDISRAYQVYNTTPAMTINGYPLLIMADGTNAYPAEKFQGS